MKNLTYIYQKGRKDRLTNLEESSKEFFYGFFNLKDKFNDYKIIEFHDDFKNNIFTYINKFLRKISGLPFFSEYLHSKKNNKIIKNSDLLITTNQRVGFSVIFKIIKSKKLTSVVFIMGLYNQSVNNPIKKFFRNKFIYFFTLIFDKLIFLSHGEYEYAKQKYFNFKNKMYFLPFSTDVDFWNTNKKKNYESPRKQILFIGNDGKRDYDFILKLASEIQDYDFVIITKKIENNIKLPKNVNLLSGKWDDLNISDKELRKIYEESHLTLIPLLDSLQPSGQSVALQSLSMGTPVIITRTKGFWEPDKFINNEHIIFLEKNEVTIWKEKINFLLTNKKFYFDLIDRGKNLILSNNTLEIFDERLERIIFKG